MSATWNIRGPATTPPDSLAGLYTALACVLQFEEVVIIEPDDGATEECLIEIRKRQHGLPVHTCPRKRVMQTFGFHGMPIPLHCNLLLSMMTCRDPLFNRSVPALYATSIETVVSRFRIPSPRIGRHD